MYVHHIKLVFSLRAHVAYNILHSTRRQWPQFLLQLLTLPGRWNDHCQCYWQTARHPPKYRWESQKLDQFSVSLWTSKHFASIWFSKWWLQKYRLQSDCSKVDTWEKIVKFKPLGLPLWLSSHSFSREISVFDSLATRSCFSQPGSIRPLCYASFSTWTGRKMRNLVKIKLWRKWQVIIREMKSYWLHKQDSSLSHGTGPSSALSSTKMWHQTLIISFCESTEWQLKVFIQNKIHTERPRWKKGCRTCYTNMSAYWKL